MRHLIDPLDFSREETDRLLALATDIIGEPGRFAHLCDGRILATLFYEPSTRTRLSFESAMMRLGGKVLGFASSVFPTPTVLPPPRAKAWPIRPGWSPGTRTSSPCGISKRARPMWLPGMQASL